MALPKLEVPTYELTLPSTNKVVKFRPFLVKEQKVLYVAQQDSENEQVISDAIGELVKNCTFDKVDPLISPVFDIEYIFLQLRSKSVGETIDIQVKCPDDNKTSVEVKINLKDVNVQMTTGHSNEVGLSVSIFCCVTCICLVAFNDIVVKDTLGYRTWYVLGHTDSSIHR